MKRIIYTAVALIICASVFGIADYMNAKNQGALVNYSDDVQTTEAAILETKKQIPVAAEEKLKGLTTKKLKGQVNPDKNFAKAKAKTSKSKIIHTPPIIETKEPTIEKMDITDLVLQSKVTDSIIETDKRRIRMEMFSRAPIREKMIKKK